MILTIDWLPPRTRYEQAMNAEPRTHVDSFNVNFLTNGGVRANADFWRDVAAELLREGAPTDYLLAYELRNEANFDGEGKPFTLTYWAGDDAERQDLRPVEPGAEGPASRREPRLLDRPRRISSTSTRIRACA